MKMKKKLPLQARVKLNRLFSTASQSSFDINIVTKDYTRKTEWAASNFGNKGSKFNIIFPPPNVTGKLHLGHALTVAVEDSFCRHHRIKGGIATWTPGFDHAGIATQTTAERKLWQSRNMNRWQLSKEEFIIYCQEFSNENSTIIQEQLKRLGATLDWKNCYYTLDQKFSDAVTRAFCELHDQKIIYRDKNLINWCPSLQSSLSDQEVDRIDVKSGSKLLIPNPKGGKRIVEVAKMYTIKYPLEDGGQIEVATTRPETIFADVALAVHPDDTRYTRFIGKRALHPLLPDRTLYILADSAVIRDKGTGVLKITPAHDFLDFEIAARHREQILENDISSEGRNCIDAFGNMCNVPSSYVKLDRFEARRKVIEELNSLHLIGNYEAYEGAQLRICSRTGDIIEPRLTSQWFMDTREMHKDVESAVKSGQIKLTPSFHEGKLFDWLKNDSAWCLSRQLVWGHQIPAYTVDNIKWISARTRKEAENILKSENIIQDEDVLDTWFSSSLVPLVRAGWMEDNFNPSNVTLSMMETGWDILGFWVIRMIMMTQKLSKNIPFSDIVLHGLIRDPNGRKMSKSLGNVIDPLDVLDGISLENMQKRVQNSALGDKEKEYALADMKKCYPNGIPKSGADALRFALFRHDVLASDISLNIAELADEGSRFCNKLWNLINYMETVVAECPKQREVDISAPTDKWILSRLADTLITIDNHMNNKAPHLAFNALHSFILGNLCDVYLESTKKALWSKDYKRIEEIRTTLTKVVQPTLVQLSVFMPFISEYLYEKVFQREAGSIYFDFVKPTLFSLYQDEELENRFNIALSAVSTVRSVKKQLQLPNKMEFAGVLISNTTHVEEISPFLYDMVNLKLTAIFDSKEKIPDKFIPCNLAGSSDILALQIEDKYKNEFIERLKRLLEKTEQRIDQFSDKAKKYQDIAKKDLSEGKVKRAIIDKSLKKAQQFANIAKTSEEELHRLKTLLEDYK